MRHQLNTGLPRDVFEMTMSVIFETDHGLKGLVAK
jgi:hypothetical protein